MDRWQLLQMPTVKLSIRFRNIGNGLAADMVVVVEVIMILYFLTKQQVHNLELGSRKIAAVFIAFILSISYARFQHVINSRLSLQTLT